MLSTLVEAAVSTLNSNVLIHQSQQQHKLVVLQKAQQQFKRILGHDKTVFVLSKIDGQLIVL